MLFQEGNNPLWFWFLSLRVSLGVKVPLCSYWSLTTWEDFLCHKVLGPNFWLKTGWNWLLISESSKSCQQHFLSSPSQTSSWHLWHNIMIVWKKKRTQSIFKIFLPNWIQIPQICKFFFKSNGTKSLCSFRKLAFLKPAAYCTCIGGISGAVKCGKEVVNIFCKC